MAQRAFRSSLIWGAVALCVLVVVGFGGLRYVERLVAQGVQQVLTEVVEKKGGTVKNASVRCDVLNAAVYLDDFSGDNIQLNGVAYLEKFYGGDSPLKDSAFNVAVQHIAIEGINLSLAWKFYQGERSPISGMQHIADQILVQGIVLKTIDENVSNTDMLMFDIQCASASMQDLQADMDMLYPVIDALQAEDAKTLEKLKTTVLPLAFNYTSSNVRDMNIEVRHPDGNINVSMAGLTAEGIVRGAIKKYLGEDLALDVRATGNSTELLAVKMKRVEADEMYLSPEALQLAYAFSLESDDEAKQQQLAVDTAKAMFLSEQPYVKRVRLTDVEYVFFGQRRYVGGVSIENPATNPFDLRVSVDGFEVPTAGFPEASYLSLMGYSSLLMNTSLSTSVPHGKNAGEKSQFKLSLGAVDVGTTNAFMEGFLPRDFSFEPTANVPPFLLSILKVGYSDNGLVARSAKIAKGLLGMNATQLITMARASLTAAVPPEQQKSPAVRALIDRVMEFMEQPGTITATYIPAEPMPLNALEQLNLTSPGLSIEVIKGAKTLEELMK